MTAVEVLWDYENQPKPKNVHFQTLWSHIRSSLLESFDRIAGCWLFLNSASSGQVLRSEISNAGFNIVDCAPSSQSKSAQVDQRIIMRLMANAFESKHAVCLISADGDYCHVLNILRNNRIHTTIIYNTHGAPLNAMCEASVDQCIGIDFRPNIIEEELSEEPVKLTDLMLRSINECAETEKGQHKHLKVSSQVGDIFRNYLERYGLVQPSTTKNDRKRLFSEAKDRLVDEGTVEYLNIDSTCYFKLK